MKVQIDYTNWRGDRRVRTIIPDRIEWTKNEWHPDVQWILFAYDGPEWSVKTFAMKDIHSWTPLPTQSTNSIGQPI